MVRAMGAAPGGINIDTIAFYARALPPHVSIRSSIKKNGAGLEDLMIAKGLIAGRGGCRRRHRGAYRPKGPLKARQSGSTMSNAYGARQVRPHCGGPLQFRPASCARERKH